MISRGSFAVIFLFLVSGAWSQQARPTVGVPLIERPAGGVESLAASLSDTWKNLLVREGFALEGSPPRFEARGTLVREGRNLILQAAIVESATRTVVASEMLTIFDGLTAAEPLNGLLQTVTRRTMAYWKIIKDSPPPVAPIEDALVFTSPDEGAEVFWQGHESIGKIVDGQITAPYYPFPSNAEIVLVVEQADKRTKTVTVPLDASATSYALPKLDALRVSEMHSFIQTGRVLGLGTEFRDYWIPEWAFWSLEAYPWVQYRPGVENSRPVLHLDTAGSVGTWLYFDADAWFRFGVQASMNLSQTVTVSSSTPGWYLDMTLPVGLLLEWNLFGVTLENRIQVPYSVGLPTGLLGRRWVLVGSNIPLFSVGTLWKW